MPIIESDPLALARLEQSIAEMKNEPDIQLESTRHYVMPDPEDASSVYDTCDSLGPWGGLKPLERLMALEELDWSGVGDRDAMAIVHREVDLWQTPLAEQQDFFKRIGKVLLSDPLRYARQSPSEDKNPGIEP